MESKTNSIFLEDFANSHNAHYINYKGLFVRRTYELIAKSIENFEVRDDDIWVCSFPKTGTTWTQEMVWNISNDLDFEGAKVSILKRFPFLEASGVTVSAHATMNKVSEEDYFKAIQKPIERITRLPSPRFIKTHLPFHHLPQQLRTQTKKARIIYVTRNPKDTCISFYHHHKLLEGYFGTFENFCQRFLENKVLYGPFWGHVDGYWKNKDDTNILCIKYEDMQKDLPSIIRKCSYFLDKQLNDKQVHDLELHLDFSEMKKNPAVNLEDVVEKIHRSKIHGDNFACQGKFLRQGTVEQWKTVMSNDLIKQFDNWIADELKKYPCLLDEFSKIY